MQINLTKYESETEERIWWLRKQNTVSVKKIEKKSQKIWDL